MSTSFINALKSVFGEDANIKQTMPFHCVIHALKNAFGEKSIKSNYILKDMTLTKEFGNEVRLYTITVLNFKIIDSYNNEREMMLETNLSSRAPADINTKGMIAIHGKALADIGKENIYQNVHYLIIDLYKYMQWKDDDLGNTIGLILADIGEL